MPEVEDVDFELLPVEDFEVLPEDQLADVEATFDVDDEIEVVDDPVEPYGRSWLYDHINREFVFYGKSPATTNELDTLEQWIKHMLWTMRMAHAIFSDDFGMDDPYRLIGKSARTDLWQAYETDLTEALLVHDRITEVVSVDLSVDPEDAEMVLVSVVIYTDNEDTVTVEDLPIVPPTL